MAVANTLAYGNDYDCKKVLQYWGQVKSRFQYRRNLSINTIGLFNIWKMSYITFYTLDKQGRLNKLDLPSLTELTYKAFL